jgi:hypothetical protein
MTTLQTRSFRAESAAVLAVLSLFAAVPAGAESAFPSTVRGITIANTHFVAKSRGTVLRGSAPGAKVSELVRAGVTDVVIFKNATGREVENEIAALMNAGVRSTRIAHIPFLWRDIPDMRAACAQVVRALALLDRVYQSSRRKVFFHCTAGKDRTGLLAGLFRLLERGGDPRKIFRDDLCAHGYAEGDRGKPPAVAAAVRQFLTPLFLGVAQLIAERRLAPGSLRTSACRALRLPPTNDFRCR